MKNICIFIFLVPIFFGACEKNDDKKADDLLYGIWQFDSIKLKEENILEMFPDTLDKKILIEFSSLSEVNLTGYCNNGYGTYIANSGKLYFNNISLTELICVDIGGIWENYLYELTNVTTYKIEDHKLILYSNNIDLYFSRQKK